MTKVFTSILAINLIGILLIPIAGFAHRVGGDTEEVHRVIEVLYGLDPDEVHDKVLHDHNNYKAPRWFAPKPCDGYEGGHSGYDVAHEDDDARFYSLTDGEVINVKHPNPDDIKVLSYISIYDATHKRTVFYLHPSYIDVRIGKRVEVGAYLGKQGATGLATGPHVHLEVRRNRSEKASCGAGASQFTNRPNENPIPFLYEQAKDFKKNQRNGVNRPDLVVEVESESTTLEPGEEFRLYSILKNQGTAESEKTTLRYYRSTNDKISKGDRQLGRGNRNPLAPNETIRRYLPVTVPTRPGTYYYGVCVDPVDNESDTSNNCSEAIEVIVRSEDANDADVNGDGIVDVEDLILVAEAYGEEGDNDADVNGDGIVDIDDLILVAEAIDDAADAPAIRPQMQAIFTQEQLRELIAEAKVRKNISSSYQKGLALLEQFFRLATPEKTALLANYPNPFNPETWIPYQLAKPSKVVLSISDADGKRIRTLNLGQQAAGKYHSRSRAAYWDGRNAVGEPVASGVYFYTLKAGDFTATRKMLIKK